MAKTATGVTPVGVTKHLAPRPPQPEALNFDWREHAKSFTAPSERRGFGTTVLENMVGRSLGATVERIVHDDGLEWKFAIPVSALDPTRGPEEAEKPGA